MSRIALLAAMSGALAPVPATASDPAADAGQEAPAHSPISLVATRIPFPDGVTFEQAGHDMKVWSEGRRGYFLAGGNQHVFAQLVAVDLDTGEEVGRVDFPTDGATNPANPHYGAWRQPATAKAGTNGPHTWTVDGAGGRLFIAAAGSNDQLNFISRFAVGRSCPYGLGPPGGFVANCMHGVHVYDAETLALLKSIPIVAFRADGGPISALPRAMSYLAPADGGRGGKLLVVLEDVILGQNEQTDARYQGLAMTYLVQLDVESGRQDWVTRLDACRGAREHGREGTIGGFLANRPNPAAVLRSASPTNPAIWVACHGTSRTGLVVRVPLDARGGPADLPVEVRDPDGVAQGAPGGTSGSQPQTGRAVTQSPQRVTIVGPRPVLETWTDPGSERFVMRVLDENAGNTAEVWWVFDTKVGEFIGTIGIGPVQQERGSVGLDPATGRFYVHHFSNHDRRYGLFTADIRRTPLPQALQFAEFDDLTAHSTPLGVLSASEGRPARVFVRVSDEFVTLEDRLPSAGGNAGDRGDAEPFAGRTLDLDEVEGVTAAVADGAARGYGARTILIGGAETATRVGPADALSVAQQLWGRFTAPQVPRPERCSGEDREVVVGFVGPDGPAVVDGSGSRGGAQPVVVDSATRSDTDAVVSRCGRQDWDALWGMALFGRAPASEPRVPWLAGEPAASCVSGEVPSAMTGDAVAGNFAARVDCDESEASGFSYARGVRLGDADVGEALSSFRVYRDPGRGIVSRVESVTRGFSLPGVLRVDLVRGSAESWANGRRQSVAADDRPGDYQANCDFERSAGTCLRQQLLGVWTPGYQCGPCGNEQAAVDALNRALGAEGRVRLRRPDATLARGAENGFTAAIQKGDHERFGDLALNNDLLPTTLPTLEMIRYTTPSVNGTGRKGRQIYQLAGVEASSSYGIACLLVLDEATNVCAAEPQRPASISVSLTDDVGNPLAGGVFEIRRDVDGDGLIGLADTLLPEGACVTAEDGVGTCSFGGLTPGDYLISQTGAPPGFGKVPEPHLVQLASGEARSVAFQNTSDASTVNVSVTDQAGRPLAGAVFEVYPDPDGDGKVAPNAAFVATCASDATGTCTMRVPAGSYVLVQTASPDGLDGIAPVPFTFASGGQTAAVGVVNHPPDSAPDIAAPVSPVYTSPAASPPRTQTVQEAAPVGPEAPLTARPAPADQLGGTIVRVIRAPGDALRLLARDPRQAVAWTASLILFLLALAAVRRRGLLATLAGAPALAVAGPPRPSAPARGHAVVRRGGVRTVSERIPLRVIVAVPDPALAAGMEQELSAHDGCELLRVAHSLETLRAAVAASPPDVLVVDVTLPTGGTDDLLDVLPGLHPPARVLGVIPSSESSGSLAARGYAMGLGGLFATPSDLHNGQLQYAVKCVASQTPFYGPTVHALLAQQWRSRAAERGTWAGLTSRELEIARLVADGMTRSQIAERLVLSPTTVKTHVRAARRKLGITPGSGSTQLRKRLDQLDELAQPADPESTRASRSR